ncbi:potassium transporter Kef [Alteromonadaceae bacterium M269]|nr:potassium transporter Kef [Alteromonadaceae bacterium M269]
MEFIWILFAFICGLGVKLINLPPLIGYLIAGFLLNALGQQANDNLYALADIGITLMLFTIGLKLNIRSLLKPEVYVSTLSVTVLWVLFSFGLIAAFQWLAIPFFSDLSTQGIALLAFGLSFSSTVCVVKILEESGEIRTRHGKIALAVLVVQDILAVIFLVITSGKIPSIWALGLFGLFFLRPLIDKLLDKSGHAELLPLTGFFLAFGAYELFEFVGVKGDLGALVIGMLLSSHTKSTELTKALMSFKDLFLIGFFLSIGFTKLPDLAILLSGFLLCLLLLIKMMLYFTVFTRLKLRARTAFLSGMVLNNYSEFGLIVVAVCVNAKWLTEEWLVIVAVAASLSFIFTSAIYRKAHSQYANNAHKLRPYESNKRLAEDIYLMPENARIIVLGMGRVGKGAYLALKQQVDNQVWGMDADPQRVEKLKARDMQVMYGDGEDADLWENLDLSCVKLVLLALPSIDDIIEIHQQLKRFGYKGQLAAIARYEDDRQKLLKVGVDKVFNFYTEVGVGFAEESLQLIEGNDSLIDSNTLSPSHT